MSRVIPVQDYNNPKPKKSKITKYTLFDFNSDHDSVDFEDIKKGTKKCLKTTSFLYDVTLDNIPFGAIIGLVITVIACFNISYGLQGCQNILMKYNTNMGSYLSYFVATLSSYLAIHSGVLLHGVSVCSLESSRECCHKKEAGCYYCCCKDKNSKTGKKCRVYQSCAQIGCQLFWGVFGTVAMTGLYLSSIAMLVFSSISTIVSYILDKSCYLYTQKLNLLVNKTNLYLVQAKQQLVNADSTAVNILAQYNSFVDLKQDFENSAMGQVTNISNPPYMEPMDDGTKTQFWAPEKYHHDCDNMGRRLSESVFNPTVEIAKGRSVIDTLNASIAETEMQYQYYQTQAKVAETACYDLAGIYDSLYLILIGVLLLLISSYIMFAVHYKYFSAWNYEMQLIKKEKNNDEEKKEKHSGFESD